MTEIDRNYLDDRKINVQAHFAQISDLNAIKNVWANFEKKCMRKKFFEFRETRSNFQGRMEKNNFQWV